MDVIELQELLQTLGIDPEYVDELVQHNLIFSHFQKAGTSLCFPLQLSGKSSTFKD